MQQFAAVCNPDKPDTNIAAVLKELSGGQTPNRVICCGHSLGGALATLGGCPCTSTTIQSAVCCVMLLVISQLKPGLFLHDSGFSALEDKSVQTYNCTCRSQCPHVGTQSCCGKLHHQQAVSVQICMWSLKESNHVCSTSMWCQYCCCPVLHHLHLSPSLLCLSGMFRGTE